MRSEIKASTLSEVYILIIEKTTESLKTYLKINKKKTGRFDIVNELKKRWKTRIDFLIDSMNGSWSKLQDSYDLKRNNINVDGKNSSTNFCFPSICSLSWDFYKYSAMKENKTSNFKLWVWNCMISGIINDGNLPIPSTMFFKENFFFKRFITRAKFLKKPHKMKKNVFEWIGKVRKNNNNHRRVENKVSILKIENNPLKIHERLIEDKDKELSDDFSLDELESNRSERLDKAPVPNFLLAIIEKVYRRNTKWTIVFKDGVLNINKKDFLFNSCKCEFFW